ncbi:MAG: anaerobic magnesium-protoporphyrin monomethyl ester cyclase [Bradyrhizobium sp.]|jgi:hypothetical protein|nr:anaerobic magnesium-protoporphyrin monomethyl ester cyclase [Bradyrhizobium sp.]
MTSQRIAHPNHRRRVFLGIVPPQATLYGQDARPQPPMGLGYAMNGAVAAGWEPVILDCCAEGYHVRRENKQENWRITGFDFDTIVTRVAGIAPDAIGVALGVSTDHDIVRKLVHRLRAAFPELPIVLGGSHASLMGARLFEGLPIERVDADFVVAGRDLASGEATTEALLRALQVNSPLADVPGLLYREGERIVKTASVGVTEEALRNLMPPRRDLFARRDGMDIYSKINRSHTGPADIIPYAVMHTSRGCGGACVFCHIQYQGFDGTLIRRDIRNIDRELAALRDNGYRTVSIEDDNFGGFNEQQTRFAIAVLDRIAAHGFSGVYFPNGLTLRSMVVGDHGVLRKLRELADAGLKVRNSLPIESGDDDTLRRIIRKPHTLGHVNRVLGELADGYIGHPNLDIDAFFMVGVVAVDAATKAPIRETLPSIERTVELARRCGDLGLRVNLWWMKPNPGGPQYELWRDQFPEKPFHELQFLFPSGIWGTEEEELVLDERIRQLNIEMENAGHGSRRPIYPVGSQIKPLEPLPAPM